MLISTMIVASDLLTVTYYGYLALDISLLKYKDKDKHAVMLHSFQLFNISIIN